MKPLYARVILLLFASLVCIGTTRPAAGAAPGRQQTAGGPTAKAASKLLVPAIRLARATWDTGWFQAEIYRQLLQELGYRVPEPRTMDNEVFTGPWPGGDVDLWVNGWFPTHNPYLGEETRRRIELVGYEVRHGALQGYLIDRKSAEEYSITNLGDLREPERAMIFDRNANGKADLVGCNAGWGCEKVIEHHLDAYALRDTVEQVQGDYSLLIHDVVSRYRRGQPVLFYTWTPNWTVGTLVPGRDVVWLQVPFPSLPESQKKPEHETTVEGVSGCVADPCAMGYPPNDIRVVANRQFLAQNPAVRSLLQAVAPPGGYPCPERPHDPRRGNRR